MSRRAAVERRLGHLNEISDILGAMKTLALLETHKLGRFLAHQQGLIARIEAAASDFLGFFPQFDGARKAASASPDVWILIGSERGFCGDFNETVRRAASASGALQRSTIAVGRGLASKLDGEAVPVAKLAGASAAEEVMSVLDRILLELGRQQSAGLTWLHLRVLAHDANGALTSQTLLPMAADPGRRFAFPPRLHVAPGDLFRDLTEQYLLAKLTGLLYESLLAENRARMLHMEGALRRTDTKQTELRQKRSALRQEEIVEEIEIILLGAEHESIRDGVRRP